MFRMSKFIENQCLTTKIHLPETILGRKGSWSRIPLFIGEEMKFYLW